MEENRLMSLFPIFESWEYLHVFVYVSRSYFRWCPKVTVKRTNGERPSYAFHSPDQPLLQLFLDLGSFTVRALLCAPGHDLGAIGSGEEVYKIDNPRLVDGPRLQDTRGW